MTRSVMPMSADQKKLTVEEKVCVAIVTIVGFWFMFRGIALDNAAVFLIGLVITFSDMIIFAALRRSEDGDDDAAR